LKKADTIIVFGILLYDCICGLNHRYNNRVMSAFCYFLYTDEGQTYIGATVDPDRRLRQHNKEIKGGAHATGIRVAQGLIWKRACSVAFPEWRTALQFEWRWKRLSQKVAGTPSNRRLRGLELLLALDRPTTAAVPYETYEAGGPTVIMEII
jgi:structure-specific endonuclease subunit SLX1